MPKLMLVLTIIIAGWRRGTKVNEEKEILSLFADDPRAPYSIHSFVHHGASACGKYPGEWFGPSATARCIQYVFFFHIQTLPFINIRYL